ncbi:hypothetical protein PMAYCL1PPCAC_21377, partial [Pristionchus mayeri]
MYGFYTTIQGIGLVKPITLLYISCGCVALHTSLFVALNRLKVMMYSRLKQNNSKTFYISILISCFLSIPALIHTSFFSAIEYRPIHFHNISLVYPIKIQTDETFQIINKIISNVVSLATLVVNLVLVRFIVKERKLFYGLDDRKHSAERGLVVYSIVSYVFHILFFINNVI